MKLIISLLFFFVGQSVQAQTEYCTKIDGELILKKTYFTISYNPKERVPNYVGYYLLPEYLKGNATRKNVFFEDKSLPSEQRAANKDYLRKGYDKGHLCPASDFKFSQKAMNETFVLSNVCPQKPKFNRQWWKKLEEQERILVKDCDTLYVISGEYSTDNTYMGKVKVPTCFYKVLIGVKQSNITVIKAWKMDNDNSIQEPNHCLISIEKLEEILGIKFKRLKR